MNLTSNVCDVMITVSEFGGGGTERYAEDIAVGLAQRDIRVVVMVDCGGLHRVRYLKANGIPIRILGAAESWSRSRYVQALRVAIKELQPRLIHANAWRRHGEIADAATSCDVPLVFTAHSTPRAPLFREWLGVNRSPFSLYRERAIFRRKAAIICISKLALDNMTSRVGRGLRAVAVYCGVPLMEPAPAPVCFTDAPRVAWVGSLIERKRPLLAIQAFKPVLRQYPNAQLLIIGDGPLMESVRSAASRLPQGAVRIRGFCSPVLNALSEGHVYMQTSAAEGLPYSVLEAMSIGLPVVATDAGATREAVVHGETGLMCKLDDVSDVSRALLHLLGSPGEMSAYGKNGVQRVRDMFSLDRMMADTLAAYKSLCGIDLSESSSAA